MKKYSFLLNQITDLCEENGVLFDDIIKEYNNFKKNMSATDKLICANDNSLYETKEIKWDYDTTDNGDDLTFVVVDDEKYVKCEDINPIINRVKSNLKSVLKYLSKTNNTYTLEDLGMTIEEYDEIMGE